MLEPNRAPRRAACVRGYSPCTYTHTHTHTHVNVHDESKESRSNSSRRIKVTEDTGWEGGGKVAEVAEDRACMAGDYWRQIA